jgi:hypothetical protein
MVDNAFPFAGRKLILARGCAQFNRLINPLICRPPCPHLAGRRRRAPEAPAHIKPFIKQLIRAVAVP